MQGKQAFISGAYRVVELGAPGHAGEHAEEVLQLCVRQGSVLVLPKHTESPGQAGPSPCQRGPCHTGHLPAVQCHRDAVNGSNRWQRGQSWASSQSLCLRDCQHCTTANILWDCSYNQAGPVHAHPTALSCCSWHSWSQLSHSSLHQSSLAFHRPTQHSQAAVPQGDLLAPGHSGMSIHSVLPLPAAAELIWAHKDVCPLRAATELIWARRDVCPLRATIPCSHRADPGTQGCVSTPCCHS